MRVETPHPPRKHSPPPPFLQALPQTYVRPVSGSDVVDVTRSFLSAEAASTISPTDRIVDHDIDSLSLSALAVELTRRFGFAVDVTTLINADTFDEVAGEIASAGGQVQETGYGSNSTFAMMRAEGGSYDRPVAGTDVVDVARAFLSAEAGPTARPADRIVDHDIDSLSLSALAVELTRRFGAPIDVATLINAETFDDVAGEVSAAGGFVHEEGVGGALSDEFPAGGSGSYTRPVLGADVVDAAKRFVSGELAAALHPGGKGFPPREGMSPLPSPAARLKIAPIPEKAPPPAPQTQKATCRLGSCTPSQFIQFAALSCRPSPCGLRHRLALTQRARRRTFSALQRVCGRSVAHQLGHV